MSQRHTAINWSISLRDVVTLIISGRILCRFPHPEASLVAGLADGLAVGNGLDVALLDVELAEGAGGVASCAAGYLLQAQRGVAHQVVGQAADVLVAELDGVHAEHGVGPSVEVLTLASQPRSQLVEVGHPFCQQLGDVVEAGIARGMHVPLHGNPTHLPLGVVSALARER